MDGTLSKPSEISDYHALDLSEQSLLIARLAHEARLVRIAWDGAGAAAQGIAQRFERALEAAMDADEPPEALAARSELRAVLEDIRTAGLRVEPSLSAMDVDGILGGASLAVLSAVLVPAHGTPGS